tara:strand:- start:360 stop:1190 length:831 start_codon:yes stop_codon:yes gene_type:complete
MATQSKFYADLGIKSLTHTEIDGNLTIGGNLTVQGTQTIIDSTTSSVVDSMMELASGNTSADLIDIGFYGNYNDGLSDGGASEYTGLFRDASDSTWKLFDGLEEEPSTTVNLSGTNYALADLLVGDLTATTLTATNGLTGNSITFPTSDGTNGQFIKTNGSGTLSFGDAGGLTEGSLTTTSTSQTTLDSWAINTYRSTKYQIQASDSTSGEYHVIEIQTLHDGTTGYHVQYGEMHTGSSPLATFTVDINIGTLRLRVTPASSNSTVFKFKKIEIAV